MSYGAKNGIQTEGDAYVKLWAAVLEQAVEDLAEKRQSRACALAKIDARNWFKSGNYGPGTFLWICAELDLDAQAILSGVSKYQ